MQNEVERIEKAEEMKELFWNLWKRNKIHDENQMLQR